MGRFAEYGLEDDKNNPDGSVEGGKKTYYCIFTDAEYKRGFYLGFAHFIASKKALKLMAASEPEPRASGNRSDYCFRCRAVPEALYYLHSPTLGLCAKCVRLGLTLIDQPPEPRPDKPDKHKRRPKEPAFVVLPEPVRAMVPAYQPGQQLALFG